jgi:RNA polymerase sigma-70 factor, ECF subfamily
MDSETHLHIFEMHRGRLFGIAYRMLGSAMEAEDMVQEAYLRFAQTPLAQVAVPAAYLTRVITNLCLDHLKSAATQRENYVGQWLPEPLDTQALPDSEVDSLSMAFMVILESLSPAERAVFLLHEVFDYGYGEIASFIGKEEAACRQLLHRAKAHVAASRPRYQASAEAHQNILQRFILAVGQGDMDGLLSLLAADAVAYSDGGGKASAALHPLVGVEAILRLLMGLRRLAPEGLAVHMRQINGQMALILCVNGLVESVTTLETDGEKIHVLRFMRNPDKLRHISCLA